MDRQRLLELTDAFVDAFNRMDLDAVVGTFAEDGLYEDSGGGRHVGREAIRAAFEPLVGGSRGTIRFDAEDIFVETDTGKVLARWRLTMTREGRASAIRGLDVMRFDANGRLAEKMAYMKVDKPHLEDA